MSGVHVQCWVVLRFEGSSPRDSPDNIHLERPGATLRSFLPAASTPKAGIQSLGRLSLEMRQSSSSDGHFKFRSENMMRSGMDRARRTHHEVFNDRRSGSTEPSRFQPSDPSTRSTFHRLFVLAADKAVSRTHHSDDCNASAMQRFLGLRSGLSFECKATFLETRRSTPSFRMVHPPCVCVLGCLDGRTAS
jgi:hypothetical protein